MHWSQTKKTNQEVWSKSRLAIDWEEPTITCTYLSSFHWWRCNHKTRAWNHKGLEIGDLFIWCECHTIYCTQQAGTSWIARESHKPGNQHYNHMNEHLQWRSTAPKKNTTSTPARRRSQVDIGSAVSFSYFSSLPYQELLLKYSEAMSQELALLGKQVCNWIVGDNWEWICTNDPEWN